MRIALWALMAPMAISVTAGQQIPTSPCDFDGFDTKSKLAEVASAKSTIAYYACVSGKCLPMTLQQGDPIVVSRVEGDWTCGYLTAKKGSAQGWIRSGDIRLIAFDPRPPLTAWVGTWVQGENRIGIQNSKIPGKLALDGEAYWHGVGDNVHSGEFSAEASPAQNHLHVAEGDADSCTIDLALIGKYILANDNNMCGGMNVRFWGIWKRARK